MIPESETPRPDAPKILASLEPEQLAAARQRFARRPLTGAEVLLLWSLRIYLLFMVAVVVYQIWSGAK